MLPQQVGFVCAVLALVCCASGLFGSLGRCGYLLPWPGVGGLSWEASRQLSLLLRQAGPEGLSSLLPAGQVVRTQEDALSCGARSV